MSRGGQRFNYDSIAAKYAAHVDSAPYNALYERPAMLELLPPIIGARILDAGCGPGWYAEQLLARGAQVDGVDASAAMVEHARGRLLGAWPRLDESRWTLQVADLSAALPFGDGIFDGIVSPLVLHYMHDWRPTLREMYRVLVPGGWLLFSTHHPAADAARIGTSNYLATEHVRDRWDWVGEVEFYRRSLTEIVDSVIESGFVIGRLVEPLPTEEFLAQKPEASARIKSQPEFLIIKANRPPL
ncbi:MAG TPA: methyltransferase domain-containing protein [Gemmatimonadaceae bacterium]|nr:methyltransferase domain-containing protein [Gemmatimonadaceae bacterium]